MHKLSAAAMAVECCDGELKVKFQLMAVWADKLIGDFSIIAFTTAGAEWRFYRG